MTKRTQRRDLVKYPLDAVEIMELRKIMLSTIGDTDRRAQKVMDFMHRARKHNTERGISPKAVRRDV